MFLRQEDFVISTSSQPKVYKKQKNCRKKKIDKKEIKVREKDEIKEMKIWMDEKKESRIEIFSTICFSENTKNKNRKK